MNLITSRRKKKEGKVNNFKERNKNLLQDTARDSNK